jgi:hypothetical protein
MRCPMITPGSPPVDTWSTLSPISLPGPHLNHPRITNGSPRLQAGQPWIMHHPRIPSDHRPSPTFMRLTKSKALMSWGIQGGRKMAISRLACGWPPLRVTTSEIAMRSFQGWLSNVHVGMEGQNNTLGSPWILHEIRAFKISLDLLIPLA